MENNLIIFGSVTPVMRSRDLLRKNGIPSMVVRTPAHIRKKSCGYSLLVKKDFSRAVSIIKNSKIRYLGTDSVDYI